MREIFHTNPNGQQVLVSVGDNVTVYESVSLGAYVRIRTGARVHPGAVIGVDATIGAHSVIETGVTIGDRAEIGEYAWIKSGSKIGVGESLHGFDGFYHWDIYCGKLRYGCRTASLRAWANLKALCKRHDNRPGVQKSLARIIRVAKAFLR